MMVISLHMLLAAAIGSVNSMRFSVVRLIGSRTIRGIIFTNNSYQVKRI